MTITFNTNVSALTAQRYLGIASDKAASSLAKLTSGSRVPTAKDDAAALAIGTQLKAEVSALGQASNNASQATSLLQIADGALSTVSDILNRQKTLAVQASSGQLDDSARALLNQEYSSLQSEVDRIANVTNFNGTSLLSGSTTVSTDVNNLAATPTSTATNLIGQGFDSIDFSKDYNADSNGNAQTGAISIAYDATSKNLTVTDLVNNKTQTVNIGATAVAAGQTQAVNFNSLGVTLSLNSQFSKTTDINATAANVATGNTALTSTISTPIAGGTTAGAFTTPTVSAVTLNGQGTQALTAANLTGAVITLGGTAAAATASASVVVGGVTHTFTQTATTDLTGATGAKTFTLSDGQGNSFTVGASTTTAPAGTITGALTLAGGSANIEAGTIKLTGVTEATASPTVTPFDFGNIDSAAVTFNAATANASTASITLNGTAFTTASPVDLSTVGTKNITLSDTNGDAISFSLNVTHAVTDGQTGVGVSLGSLGTVVAAKADVTSDNTFSFKVGTGTTANDDISFSLGSVTTAALGTAGTDISTSATANAAITAVTSAITTVASRRADIGASESRLGFATDSVNVAIENTTAAESGLLDVDVSSEITSFSSQQVLLQAGVSLLAQANQQPSLLLKLLG